MRNCFRARTAKRMKVLMSTQTKEKMGWTQVLLGGDYRLFQRNKIGKIDQCCRFRFKNGSPGLLFSSGNVSLSELHFSPEPLLTWLSGSICASKHFLVNTRNYNSGFQVKCFGVKSLLGNEFIHIFKVQD